MKSASIVLLLAVAMASADTTLTLDPAVMEEAKRAVFNGEPMRVPEKRVVLDTEQGDMALWQEAMDAAGTEMMPVRLLVLLQKLNPAKSMADESALYAEALRLHVLAAAGNREARLGLSDSFRRGVLPNGLLFICDAAAAATWRP